jgi:hypothetical protein
MLAQLSHEFLFFLIKRKDKSLSEPRKKLNYKMKIEKNSAEFHAASNGTL